MDDEKLQRTMDFILNSQAQFTIDIQKIQAEQKYAIKRNGALERVSLNLYNTTVEQGKNIPRLSEDIKELRAAQKETDERFKETDERLNAVILLAEKYFSGENGKGKKK